MSTWTAKEWVVLFLTLVVGIVLIIPVLGSTIAAMIHGAPINRPEFLDKFAEIVVYILGVLSGYVLREPRTPDVPK